MKKLFLPVSLLSGLIFIFFGLFYYLFDQYVESVGIETVTAWAKNEENSILEGNLLSSVTKAQKMLLSSEVVKGVAIFDLTDIQRGPLIEFGAKINLLSPEVIETKIENNGLLRKLYSIKSPSDENLRIVFSIFSEKIFLLFWITSGVFSGLTIIFVIAIFSIRRKQQIKIERFAQKAKQAAHDLAHPIVLLNSLIQDLGGKSHETIKSSIDKINSIADDLTEKKFSLKRELAKPKKEDLTFFQKINQLFDEIRISANQAINISFESTADLDQFLFDQDYMVRIFSNLIQNSIEAKAAQILLKASSENGKLVFILSDNGSGIPEQIMSKIGEENFTFGKKYGTGLGLFAAKQFVSENKGHFVIESKEGFGTKITITFLINQPQKVILTDDTKVLVLDDEDLMHYVWKEKLNLLKFKVPVEYFKNSSDFSKRFSQLNRDEIFLFSDYNLNESCTGLDVIESFDMAQQSALVTAQEFDPKIQTRARIIGTQLIGKSALKDLEIIVV